MWLVAAGRNEWLILAYAWNPFVVLEVAPFSDAEQKLEQPPFDGPELKYRFGRHVESLTGCDVFGYRI